MLNWIIDNKEWLFSGVGIVTAGLIIRFYLHYYRFMFKEKTLPVQNGNIIQKATLDDVKKYDQKVKILDDRIEGGCVDGETKNSLSFIFLFVFVCLSFIIVMYYVVYGAIKIIRWIAGLF